MISQERMKFIFSLMDPEMKLQPDVYPTIQALLQPWTEGITKLTSHDQINQFMVTYFPPDIFQIACIHLDELTKEIHLKTELVKATLSQKRIRLIEVLVAAILEVGLENAQECSSKEIDAYDLYVGIQKNSGLTQLFGASIPRFQYSDNLLIEEILTMLRPDLETTQGCRTGLENYIGTLIGLTTNYTPQMIDRLADQFALSPAMSPSRIEAIRRLKISIVDYFIRQTRLSAHDNRQLTFLDVVRAINTMNLVVTLKSAGSTNLTEPSILNYPPIVHNYPPVPNYSSVPNYPPVQNSPIVHNYPPVHTYPMNRPVNQVRSFDQHWPKLIKSH